MTKRSQSSACLDDATEDTPRAESPVLRVDLWDNKRWLLNGELHRVDGPAVEFACGSKEWYVNGKEHRLNGPACEYNGGNKYWYVNGKRHRLDGPAVEFVSGYKAWCLCGQIYTEAEFDANVALLKKLFGNLKAKRFLKSTRHNRQFIESFYAEGGMGRRWDLASLERVRLALEC